MAHCDVAIFDTFAGLGRFGIRSNTIAPGLVDTPLMCAQEMDVAGALERVIRILVHAETTTPRHQMQHVYLRGAEVLRQDLQP